MTQPRWPTFGWFFNELKIYLLAAILAAILTLGYAFVASREASPQSISTQCIANASAQGLPDAITIPALPCELTTNLLLLTASAANATTTPTIQPLGSPAQPIVRPNGSPLLPGDISGQGFLALLSPNGTEWVLLNPANATSSLSVQATLAPTAQSLPQTLRDVDYLRGFGFIGDGNTHPLSSVTAFGTLNTTGYSLAQWQGLLPAATALSDEVDWAAVQSIIKAATGPIALRFPIASAMMNHAISVCGEPVAFYGSGGMNYTNQGTNITFTGATDGIDHCTGAGTGSKIELHDINLTSTTLTGSLWGINDLTANYTLIDNVGINGFNNCVHFVNPGGTRLRSVFCYSEQTSGTATLGEGVLYEGQNSFVNHIESVLVQNYTQGYDFNSTNTFPGPNVGIEDMQEINSACGGVKICIVIRAVSPNYGGLSYSFTNMSVDATSQFIQAPNCNGFTVDGGNWLVDVPVGSWTGGFNLIDIGTSSLACHAVRLRDMYFFDQATVTINSLLTVEAAANDVQFSGAHIETNNVTATSYYIQAAVGTFGVIEKDNEWNQAFAHIAPPSNAVVSNSTAASNKLESAGLGIPTLSTNCGSGATLAASSNNSEGIITEGSGSPTSCTLNFAQPLRAINPVCVLFNTQGPFPLTMTAANVSGVAYSHAAGAQTVYYNCRPY